MVKPVPTTVPTTIIGPLGSTVHVLRADADTVAALATIDWNRQFRRVCVDPARGLITLMADGSLRPTYASQTHSVTIYVNHNKNRSPRLA